jgi:hypothetical protein
MPNITTPADLDNIRNDLAADYIITADIDLSGYANWEPIGTEAAPFTGTLVDDGNGRTISNLTINRPTEDNVGLFGVCSFSRTTPSLSGISIVNADITGQDNTGALAGKVITDQYLDSGGFDMILECDSAGTVIGRNNVGGLVGSVKGPAFPGWDNPEDYTSIWVDGGIIARVNEGYSLCVVSGSGTNIGGLVGSINEILVKKSRALGAVTGGDIVGGLVGYAYRSNIEWCYATGNVTGYKTVGGLLGKGAYRPNIEKSYAEGDVTATAPLEESTNYNGAGGVGGLIGETDLAFVHDNYAIGDVSGPYRVGGLIGCCYGGEADADNIEYCYAHGNVSGEKAVGGLIGYIYGYVSYPSGSLLTEIDKVYCTGSVTGQSNVGAVIGEVGKPPWPAGQLGTPKIKSPMFFNSDVNNASTVNGGEGRTSADLGYAPTYSEWESFDRHMVIDLDESPYPILLCFYDPLGISISAMRGFGQGLVLGYVSEGKIYHRTWDGATWAEAVEVTQLAGAKTLNLFRTSDNRVGFVVDIDGRLYFAVTDTNLMTIAHSQALVNGAYGNLVHLDDRVKLYYVTSVQTIAEQLADFTGDWTALDFRPAEPLPSDSYVSRLRVKQLAGSSHMVWRSRGQHRYLVRDEAETVPETRDVVEGSIALRIDSPVVSCSLELLNFERATGEGGEGGEGGGGTTTSEIGCTEYVQQTSVPDGHIGYTECVQQTSVPDGYIGVYTAADLIDIASDMAAKYIQMADIDLTEHGAWTALIGPPNGLFEGIYDGNGYEITGLTGNGLFVGTHNNYTPGLTGEIKNVKIINADTSGNGAIISDYHEGIITNCYVSGNACISAGNYGGGIISYCTANVNIVSDNYETGAICGGNYGGSEIKYCCSSGSIINSCLGSSVGGLIAYNGDVTTSVHDCYSTCSIIALNAAQVGGLIGYNGSDAAVTNCYAVGNVITDGGNVGGLIGYNDSAYAIVNCHATGNIATISGDAGGLVGYNYGNIENCYATGNVSGTHKWCRLGGLVGYCGGTVSNSYATGEITNSECSYAGGFAGTIEGNITNCYATGNVIGNAEYAGGFAAYFGDYSSPPTISKCFATGNVKGARYASGFVGLGWYGNVDNCYAFGSAEATVTTDDYGAVGGFLGEGDLQIANCYSVGLVTGVGDNVGGFIGWENFIAGGGTATNCFYNSETSGQSDTGKGEPKTTAEMLLEATYSGWDFAAVWKLSSITKGYPALQWQFGSNEPLANYPPASFIQLQFRAGDSEPYPMGCFYVDRTQVKAGDPMVSVDTRNSVGKYLKDQTFDERGYYSTATMAALFAQILTNFGITNYYVGANTKQLSIQFSPSQTVLDGITDLLKFTTDWMIRENADGKVVIADRDDTEHTQPGKYTFYRNRDIFSREQTKDDSTCYGRVCVHDQSFNIMVYRPVSYTLSWLPPAQKTYYVSMPDGITNADATALATEIADQLSNSGEVETFVGPFRPHLLPGDEAEIMDADGPTLLGVITTVEHEFGKRGFITTVTIDSGGKVGKPMLSDYLAEIANRISQGAAKITY